MKTSSSLSSSTKKPTPPSNQNEDRNKLSFSTASRTRRASRPSFPLPEPLPSPESSSVETSPLVDKGNEFAAPTLAQSDAAHSELEEEDTDDFLDPQIAARFDEDRKRYGDDGEAADELDDVRGEEDVRELDEESTANTTGAGTHRVELSEVGREGNCVGSKSEVELSGLGEGRNLREDEEDASRLGEGSTVRDEETAQMEPAEFESMRAIQESDMLTHYTSGYKHILKMSEAASQLETLYQGPSSNRASGRSISNTVKRIALTLASDVGRFEEMYVYLGESLPRPEVWDRMNEEYRSSFEMNRVLQSLEEALAVAKGKCAGMEKQIERDHLVLETSQSSDRREIELKTSQLLEATSVIADLRSKVNQISLELAATRTELDRAQEEVSALKEEVEVATDLHRELTSNSTDDAEEEVATELGVRDTRLDVVLEEKDCEIAALKESLVTSEAELADTIAAKDAEIASLAAESAEQLKISQEEVDQLANELATLKANYASLRARSE